MKESRQVLKLELPVELEQIGINNVSVTVLDEQLAYAEGEFEFCGGYKVPLSKVSDDLLNKVKDNLKMFDESKKLQVLILDANHCYLYRVTKQGEFEFSHQRPLGYDPQQEPLVIQYMDLIKWNKFEWKKESTYDCSMPCYDGIGNIPIEKLTSIEELSKLVDELDYITKCNEYDLLFPNQSAMAALAQFSQNNFKEGTY